MIPTCTEPTAIRGFSIKLALFTERITNLFSVFLITPLVHSHSALLQTTNNVYTLRLDKKWTPRTSVIASRNVSQFK